MVPRKANDGAPAQAVGGGGGRIEGIRTPGLQCHKLAL